MALVDDLKDSLKKNSADKTDVSEQHEVAAIGETHEFLMTAGSEIRTRAMVRLLLEDRKLNRHVPGLLLLGSFHAAAVPDRTGHTTRMLLEDRVFTCISMRVLTDFGGPRGF